MLLIFPPTPSDKYKLAANAKQEEINEVTASHGKSILEVLEVLEQRSDEVYAIYDDDVLLGMTGVVPYTLLRTTGSPWLLTTKEMPRHPRHLLKGTRQIIERWKHRYTRLENYVDARYTASLRWAKWAGFTVYDAEPYGYAKLPFHRIEIRSA